MAVQKESRECAPPPHLFLRAKEHCAQHSLAVQHPAALPSPLLLLLCVAPANTQPCRRALWTSRCTQIRCRWATGLAAVGLSELISIIWPVCVHAGHPPTWPPSTYKHRHAHCLHRDPASARCNSVADSAAAVLCADNVRGMQVIKGFAAKSDGKDKLTALVQVRCHSLSEGSRRCVRRAAASTTQPDACFLLPVSCCPPQYLCLFLSAGQPGQLKKVQASVTAARKVFRIMRVSTQQLQQSAVGSHRSAACQGLRFVDAVASPGSSQFDCLPLVLNLPAAGSPWSR